MVAGTDRGDHVTRYKQGGPGNLDGTKWQADDVEQLSSARRVVDTVLKLEKACDR